MLVAFMLVVAAQEPVSVAQLRLDAVIAEVRSRNPRAAAARERAEAAAGRIAAARAPMDPQLQLGVMNYTVPGFAPMAPLGMTQLQLMQMVPTAGKLRRAGNAAAADADAVTAAARETEWAVRTAAATAFYELYALDRSLEVARRTVRLLQDTRSVAEAMYRVGEGYQADVLRALVQIDRMVEDTLRMAALRVGVSARLNALRNRSPDAPVPPAELPAFPADVPAMEDVVASAERGRPAIQSAEHMVIAAGSRTDLARREIWPDVAIGLQYGRRGAGAGVEQMGSLMIGATLPVFARHRQLRMRDEATALQHAAEADLAAMRADTRAEATTVHANLVRARRLSALYRTTILPQAEAAVASALAAYRTGSAELRMVLDGRMTVNEYERELLALEAEEGTAWAMLEALMGKELPATVAAHGVAGTDGGGRS